MGLFQVLGIVTLALRTVFMFGNCLGLSLVSFSYRSELYKINFVVTSPSNPISY